MGEHATVESKLLARQTSDGVLFYSRPALQAMVMSMVPDELRGRALGLLTMAIGAGPFGMAALGELAEAYGAPRVSRYPSQWRPG